MKHCAIVLFAFALPATAMAGDFRFHYASELLTAPGGVEQLHSKLKIDSNRYCREQYITLNVRGQQECSRALMEQTIERIGNAQLAAYQESRSDRSS